MSYIEELAGDLPQKWPRKLRVYASAKGSSPDAARLWCKSVIPAGAEIIAESHHAFYDRIAFRVCCESFDLVPRGTEMPIVYEEGAA